MPALGMRHDVRGGDILGGVLHVGVHTFHQVFFVTAGNWLARMDEGIEGA